MPPVTARRTCHWGGWTRAPADGSSRTLSKYPVRARGVVEGVALINGWRVPRCHVTALAEKGQLGDQHAVVVAAVRIVARGAAVHDRRVLPQERAALLGVATRAALVHRGADTQQLDVHRSVDVVAGRALHPAFADRHVIEALLLVRDGLVALRAGDLLGLGLHQLRPFRRVHAVAVDALDVAVLVLTTVPQGVVAPVVAGLALAVGHRR